MPLGLCALSCFIRNTKFSIKRITTMVTENAGNVDSVGSKAKDTSSDERRPRLEYAHKIILAPMVRVGTLPMRLLALNYGADIVYTEELIDWKLLKTTRQENPVLGTIDYVDEADGTIVFRTCSAERDKVVLQMGTCCAERALRVGRMVEADVAGIDINMGCPKEFSIKGGMGAALMTKPENAKDILRTLVQGLSIPVTCKVRIFPELERTLKLVKELEECGISAITVHGRTRQERPQHAVHTDVIRAIAQHLTIPVIANGGSKDISTHNHIHRFREICGASSVMIARAAQWNPSIFTNQPELQPLDDVIKTFLKLSVDYDNNHTNTKYSIQIMLRDLQESPRGKLFLECQTLEDICEIWSMGRYCRTKMLEFQDAGNQGRREVVPGQVRSTATDDPTEQPLAKRFKLANDDETLIELNVVYFRTHYASVPELPKSVLFTHARLQRKLMPVYETKQVDRLFRSVVTFDDRKYSSTFWEKNKKNAEQGAALVCILSLGLIAEEVLIKRGAILK